MASNCVVRYLNVKDVYNAAMHNLRIKGLIDSNKYKILMSGIVEAESEDEKDSLRVLVQNLETETDETIYFELAKDLNICPKTLYNYFLYRFPNLKLQRGAAVKIYKQRKDENDLDYFAYNAVIINSSPRQISFVMVPSRGPMTRYLSARECYENNIDIYIYNDPNDLEYKDNWVNDHVGEVY